MVVGWNNNMVNNLNKGQAQVDYTVTLGLLQLRFRDSLPEPGDPHRRPLLVQLVCLSTVLLLQHATLDQHRDVGKAQAVDERPDKHPLLAQVPGEEVQAPPPELLTEVVRVARVPPQAILKSWDGWLTQLFQLLVPGDELVQQGVSKVSNDYSCSGDGCGHEVPDAPWLVAGVDGVHGQADADQEHLSANRHLNIIQN